LPCLRRFGLASTGLTRRAWKPAGRHIRPRPPAALRRCRR
jgi:hypothetical protein